MATPPLQLKDCRAHIDVDPHYAYPSFQKNLTLVVTHPVHGTVASLLAVHINRFATRLGGRFLQIMDEDQQELADFSQALFDKFGFLKKHLIENPQLRGTGAWGREMDSGALIYIFAITVDEQFRGRGVGSWMIKQLLNSVYVHDEDFLVCWPAPLEKEYRVEPRIAVDQWTQLHNSQIRFFQKNNFRRIGRTQFFALSANPDHSSRSIAMVDDAPDRTAEWSSSGHLDAEADELEGLSPLEARRKTVELRHARYPLHSVICELKDETIVHHIQMAFDVNPDSIHRQDDHGFTPVFAAASSSNVHALRKLIELSASGDLTSRNNADGLTPLEACTAKMISSREFSETMLQRWEGYSKDELLCAAAMKRVISPANMTFTDEEYAERGKWGCTCGMCLDGWFSPRMKARLEYGGELNFDIMFDLEDVAGFVNNEPVAPRAYFVTPNIDYIPVHLRDHVNITFYDGFRCVFEAVTCLSRRNVIPFPADVRQTMLEGGFRGHSPRAVDFYFSKGGIPDYALDCLLEAAEEQSPLGGGDFDDTFAEDLQRLPECANDLEFNLVRQNLNVQSRGPYRNLESDSEMQDYDGGDEEEEDDEEDDDEDEEGEEEEHTEEGLVMDSGELFDVL